VRVGEKWRGHRESEPDYTGSQRYNPHTPPTPSRPMPPFAREPRPVVALLWCQFVHRAIVGPVRRLPVGVVGYDVQTAMCTERHPIAASVSRTSGA